MARVLVVEDEERYREVVCKYLSLQGHEIWETANGQEAIDLGLVHRPDVLVADWMLRHSLHGLHVAEALRIADPSLHTVLVTGFPASDVTVDTERVGISDILEKPFDMEDLDRAVRRAAEASEAEPALEVVGLLLVRSDGSILQRNRAARELLSEAPTGGAAGLLGDLLAEDVCQRVFTEPGHWIRTELLGGQGRGVWIRARRPDKTGPAVVLLCAVSQEWRRADPRVRILLGQPVGADADDAFRDAMLLIDDSGSVRATFVAQLAHRGCPAHAAGRHAEAIEIFRGDPTIRIVLLDWAMPGEDLRNTVAQLREIRPETRLIGTSGEDRSHEFAELGIHDFLLKPWTVAGELARILAEDVPSS